MISPYDVPASSKEVTERVLTSHTRQSARLLAEFCDGVKVGFSDRVSGHIARLNVRLGPDHLLSIESKVYLGRVLGWMGDRSGNTLIEDALCNCGTRIDFGGTGLVKAMHLKQTAECFKVRNLMDQEPGSFDPVEALEMIPKPIPFDASDAFGRSLIPYSQFYVLSKKGDSQRGAAYFEAAIEAWNGCKDLYPDSKEVLGSQISRLKRFEVALCYVCRADELRHTAAHTIVADTYAWARNLAEQSLHSKNHFLRHFPRPPAKDAASPLAKARFSSEPE